MLTEVPKSPIPQWNPHADPDHHQNFITSRGSFTPWPCLPSLIDIRFRVRQLSCLQNDKEWQNNHITSALLAEIMNMELTSAAVAQVWNTRKNDTAQVMQSEWHNSCKRFRQVACAQTAADTALTASQSSTAAAASPASAPLPCQRHAPQHARADVTSHLHRNISTLPGVYQKSGKTPVVTGKESMSLFLVRALLVTTVPTRYGL